MANDYKNNIDPAPKDLKVEVGKLADMIIGDGTFLGVPLPPQAINQIRQFLPVALAYATRTGQKLATEQFQSQKIGKGVGIAIALSIQLIETIQNLYFLVNSLNNLHATTKPLAKAAGNHSALTMGNEAIEDLRGKIITAFMNKMFNTVIGTIGAIPALMETMVDVNKTSKHLELDKALEATGGDPNEIAKILKDEHYGVGTTAAANAKKGLTGAQMQNGVKKLIEEELALYQTELNAFKNPEKVAATKAKLTTEIGKLTQETYPFQIERLKKEGLDVSKLEENLTKVDNLNSRRFERDRYGNPVDARSFIDSSQKFEDVALERAHVIDQWKAPLIGDKKSAYLDHAVEELLTREYVENNGAFNKNWTKYLDADAKGQPTRQEKLEKSIKDGIQEREKIKQEAVPSKEKTDFEKGLKYFKDFAPGLIAGWAQNAAISIFGGTALEKLKKPLAAERIAFLDKVLTHPKNEADWKPPERVPAMEDRNSSDKSGGKNSREGLTEPMGYTKYIHEIIQTHQNTRGRAEVGERYVQHFADSDWKDSKIQELRDDELTPYEYALKHITKRILDGRLTVPSLLELVGNKQGNRIVQADGRTFGPKGAGTDEAQVKEEMLKLIEGYSVSVNTGKALTSEQLSERKGKLLFGEKNIKEALESKDIDPACRALIFRLYSDVIGGDTATICKELGINDDRCSQLRKECNDFNFMMDGVLGTLGQQLQNDPDKLKILSLTPTEKELITSLNGRKQKLGGHVVDLTKEPEDMSTLNAIAFNAIMTFEKDKSVKFGEDGTQISFWDSVKQQIDELKNPKEVTQHNDHEDLKLHTKRNPHREGDHAERESFSHREKVEKPNHDKGHHEKKWAADKHHDDDGFSGRVRRNKMESESEPARGGLL